MATQTVAITPTPKPVRQIVGINTAGSSPGQASMSTPGLITAVVQTQSTTIIADAVVDERWDDELVITEHPVAEGATISDHAYKLPVKLDLTYAWSAGSPQNIQQDSDFLKNLYNQLLGLQTSRTLCQVFTGKRFYQNMIIRSVTQTTDKDTENSLVVRLTMQEIIIVSVQFGTATSTPASVQQEPQNTAPIVPQGNQILGDAPTFNSSALPV